LRNKPEYQASRRVAAVERSTRLQIVMLSRLPVMAPIGWRLDCEAPTETRPLINTAPQKTAPQKPPPRETAALFKEVSLPRTPK